MGISAALGSSALLPAGLGFRNVLINGEFRINQRAYASAANLASGAYGFDRWKSTFTNTTLTFTSAPQGQMVTINSGGSVEQVIERANVTAGTYILSWEGTATGRVYNTGATAPSYAASPILVTLDGLANVEVEFTASGGTRTLWKAQLERNFQPTPFEQRPIGVELALCQRYYQVITGVATGSAIAIGWADFAGTASSFIAKLCVEMRAIPTTGFSGTIFATDYSVYRQLTAVSSDRNTKDTLSFNPSYSGGTLNANRVSFIYSTGGSLTASSEL
jgi:hypothetical protein